MEFKYAIGKHEFIVICDKDEILKQIENERAEFEENYYQSNYTIGSEDGYLTKEEYNKNLDDMTSLLESITTEKKMTEFIEKATKKKNGTFYKNRVAFREGCDNTIFITEWHNTWIYNALSVSAINDTTLEIAYIKVTDTPA